MTRPLTTAPVLLAIDSTTETLFLAACADGRSRVWHGVGGAQASVILLSKASELLAELGVGLKQLDAVAFARGPGAFTGLRTACSTAQGLAFGVGCGVLPLDSLMIVAQAAAGQAPATNTVVGVVMDARMGELYAGVFRAEAGAWQVLEAPVLITPPALATHWQGHNLSLAAGSGTALLAAACGESTLMPTTAAVTDEARAAALLVLAQQAWAAGELRPASEALPLYVRDKVAQTVAEREAHQRQDAARR